MTFRPYGYEARTPDSPTEDVDVSGALEYAGPFFTGHWMSNPKLSEEEQKETLGKLFYTRGDIFTGVFYKDLMKEGIMERLQSDGTYIKYRETYDPVQDSDNDLVAKN